MNLKEFVAKLRTKAKDILSKFKNWEVGGIGDPAEEADGGGGQLPRCLVHDWITVILVFSLDSVVQLAAISLQVTHQFSFSFYLFSMAILLAFVFAFLSKFTSTPFPKLSSILEKIAVFFAFTLVFIGTSIRFPLWLKCVVWVIYSLSLLAVLVLHFMIMQKQVNYVH